MPAVGIVDVSPVPRDWRHRTEVDVDGVGGLLGHAATEGRECTGRTGWTRRSAEVAGRTGRASIHCTAGNAGGTGNSRLPGGATRRTGKANIALRPRGTGIGLPLR